MSATAMTVSHENGFLNIRIPVQNPPTLSKKSGKTFIIASTGGFTKPGLIVNKLPLSLNIVATIPATAAA